jgi:hypothetical protein
MTKITILEPRALRGDLVFGLVSLSAVLDPAAFSAFSASVRKDSTSLLARLAN